MAVDSYATLDCILYGVDYLIMQEKLQSQIIGLPHSNAPFPILVILNIRLDECQVEIVASLLASLN